jgi:hypothetical protein
VEKVKGSEYFPKAQDDQKKASFYEIVFIFFKENKLIEHDSFLKLGKTSQVQAVSIVGIYSQ